MRRSYLFLLAIATFGLAHLSSLWLTVQESSSSASAEEGGGPTGVPLVVMTLASSNRSLASTLCSYCEMPFFSYVHIVYNVLKDEETGRKVYGEVDGVQEDEWYRLDDVDVRVPAQALADLAEVRSCCAALPEGVRHTWHRNSMLNRFRVIAGMSPPWTPVVLTDDDVVVSPEALSLALDAHVEHGSALTGFIPRLFRPHMASTHSWEYRGGHDTYVAGGWNMVLPSSLVCPGTAEHMMRDPRLARSRWDVERHINCDDILLSVAAGLVGRPRLQVNLGPATVDHQKELGDTGLWARPKHVARRRECIFHLVQDLGNQLPLAAAPLATAKSPVSVAPPLVGTPDAPPPCHQVWPAALDSSTFRPVAVHMFGAIVVDDSLDLGLLSAWLYHARKVLRVDEIWMLHFSPPNRTASAETIEEVERLYRGRRVIVHRREREFDVAYMAGWRQRIQNNVLLPWYWAIEADLDELIVLPSKAGTGSVRDYLAEVLAEDPTVSAVVGYLADRVSADGVLRLVSGDGQDIFEQFPYRCHIEVPVEHNKVLLHRGYHRVTHGHHFLRIGKHTCTEIHEDDGVRQCLPVDDGRTDVNSSHWRKYERGFAGCTPIVTRQPGPLLPVDHFRWRPAMKDIAAVRVAEYERLGYSFAHDAESYMNALTKEGNVCVDCPQNHCLRQGME